MQAQPGAPQVPSGTAGQGPSAGQGTQPSSALPAAGAANLNTVEALPAVKKTKKRKFQESYKLPEKVAHIIPESHLFNRLVECNRKADEALQHRKSDIKEAAVLPEHIKKKLRVYVYNTHAHQHQEPPANGNEPTDPASWVLCINGRVMEPSEPSTSAPALTPQPVQQGHQKHPFTWYLRKVEVKLDPAQYPGDSGTVVWERQNHAGPHKDTLEIRRKGSHNAAVQIKLYLDWQPERFILPTNLADVLGVRYDTRPRILTALWTYIKRKELQDPRQPQVVNLNPELQQVFNLRAFKLSQVGEKVQALLQPMPPSEITYTVRVDGSSPTTPDCYDIDIELPTFSATDRLSNLDRFSKDQEIEILDAKIAATIKRINEHRRRRAFLLGFSQSPVDFTHALLASQARDLRVVRNSVGRDFDLERRSETFHHRWVEDAVMKHLHKKLAAGH